MTLSDFHLHTNVSFDGEACAEEMCAAVLRLGLSGAALTDHVEMVDYEKDGIGRVVLRARETAEEAREKFRGRLPVAVGIEMGEPLFNLTLAQEILNYPYDFVLASVHRLGEEPDYYFQDFKGTDIAAEMTRYFDEAARTVAWGRFHALAHLTYPFRYIPKYIPAEKCHADYSLWQDQIDAIFKKMAGTGLALEINTSGLRGQLGLTQPDLPLIKRFRELGGERITLGSDAHRPEDVGAGLRAAAALAAAAGFRYTCSYYKGEPVMSAL